MNTSAVLYEMSLLLALEGIEIAAHQETVRQLGGQPPFSQDLYSITLGKPTLQTAQIVIATCGLTGIVRAQEYVSIWEARCELLQQGDLRQRHAAQKILLETRIRKMQPTVVSPHSTFKMEKMLRITGLFRPIDRTVSRDDTQEPDAPTNPFREGLRLLRVKPQEALAVVQSDPACKAALAIGIPVVAVKTDYNKEHVFAGAQRTVEEDAMKDPGIFLDQLFGL